MCSRWRSKSVASAELAPESVTSSQASPHCVTEEAKNFRCHHHPSPASSLILTSSNRSHSLSQLLTVNTLSDSFSSLCLKEHRISMPFLICPHNSLTAQQVQMVCRCGNRGRKSPTIYEQSSSPVLSSLNQICTFFFVVLNLYQVLYFA